MSGEAIDRVRHQNSRTIAAPTIPQLDLTIGRPAADDITMPRTPTSSASANFTPGDTFTRSS